MMLKKAGLMLNKKSNIHKRLVLGNALVDALKLNSQRKKTKQKSTIQFGAMIIKKYRCIDKVSKETGKSSRKLSTLHHFRIRGSIKQKYVEKVIQFLEREDNSTTLPGKRDAEINQKQAT